MTSLEVDGSYIFGLVLNYIYYKVRAGDTTFLILLTFGGLRVFVLVSCLQVFPLVSVLLISQFVHINCNTFWREKIRNKERERFVRETQGQNSFSI